ncbi:MAG: hypothetical protein K8T91_13970 [Planctomycetes bacterium]|nr:hypothetical protein [Planctomycetota bacterium]
MKRVALGSLTLVLMATVGSLAQAQPPRGANMGRGGMTLTGLLAQESVQKELKLTEEQIKTAKELGVKQRESFGGLRDLPAEERMTKIQERIKENEKALAGVIGGEQMTRLKQISLQTRGVIAFSDPTVVTALTLTDEQKDKIKAIQEEARTARGEFNREKPEESRAKIEAARKAAAEKVQAVLTTEQATKWKELIGAPFTGEIKRPDFERGGGGRRRGGDRPRGNTPPADQA